MTQNLASSAQHRGLERFFYCPTSFNPAMERRYFNAKFLGPFANGFDLAVIRDKPVRSAISSLLQSGGPAAISRLIITIIINAVKGMLRRWAWPHILQKIIKGLLPTITNLDASTAIIFPTIAHLVFTTGAHQVPYIVFGCAALAMSLVSLNNKLSAVTSTTNNPTFTQVFRSVITKIATITTTMPIRLSVSCSDGAEVFNNGKAPKSLTKDIYCSWINYLIHNAYYSACTHIGQEAMKT